MESRRRVLSDGNGTRPGFQPDPELFPFRSRWFDARAGRMHYIDEGEGPPILFLHGNPTWGFLYRRVVLRLRDHFRCIVPDYLGFGLSDHPDRFDYSPRSHAETVRQLVRHLDLDGFTIVGHDWGGPIGMAVALDLEPRVRALVMGNTWYWPTDTLRMRAFARAMSSGSGQRMIVRKGTFVERALRWGTLHPLAASVVAHYKGVLPTPASRRGVAELPRQLLASSFWLGELAYAVPRRLAHLPILLLWGEQDRAFPPRLARRFERDFDRVEECGLVARHFVAEDASDEMCEAIEDFLFGK